MRDDVGVFLLWAMCLIFLSFSIAFTIVDVVYAIPLPGDAALMASLVFLAAVVARLWISGD